MDELCAACAALNLQRSDFTTPPFEPEGRYHARALEGTVGALQHTRHTCGLCALIWGALDRGNRELLGEAEPEATWYLMWSQNTNDYQPSGEIEDVEDMFGSALYACLDAEGALPDYGIQLIDHADTDGFLRGRVVYEDMDLERFSTWIGRCIQTHGDECGSRLLRRRDFPDSLIRTLIVIDVRDQCLLQLPAGARYAALSYVWGDTNTPVALLKNKAAFAETHGLAIKLPQTVRDAIDVSRALGLRFLWVDSLCITQDDSVSKQLLIDNMDVIYSSAHVTLVAATGTGAHSGLSGWSHKQGRDLQYVQVDKDLRLGMLPYYQRELLECDHAKRAWTYQETCLSPRCLVFLNGHMYFNCNAAVYSEHVHAEVNGIEPEASANTLGKTETMGSLIQHYSQYVAAYTSRQMKYDSDALNAFRGIANALAPSMGVDTLLYGIAVACFDSLILWSGRGSLSRRRGFPSWSWAGWKGEVLSAVSTDNAYDQSWLLKGTWIDWCRVDTDGMCSPLWDSQDVDFIVSPAVQIIPSRPPQTDSSDTEDSGSGEDEELLEGFYPTYGHSTYVNPFGRVASSGTVAPWPRGDSQGFRSMRLSLGELDHTNMICFSAPCVTLKATELAHSSERHTRSPVLGLHDREGRVCAVLSIHDDTFWASHVSQNLELVLTSLTTYGDLNGYRAAGYTSIIYESQGVSDDLTEYLEAIPNDVDRFDFVNVLLMVESGTRVEVHCHDARQTLPVSERAGIGCLYSKALQQGEVAWKNVVML